ncbi:MAG: DUF4981 domain-containing protein, partial [Clostridiales bacterium]|nr:DUF4981 domain-containing protein [Clostridiales bacterium]
MQNRSYLANPHLTGENRLPARSLLIPAQKRGVTHKNFFQSDRVCLLNGLWKFRWLEEDTEEEFFAPGFDDASWDEIPVPSMWQFCGYGTCFYPNVRYCFPYDPPYVHGPNPVGLYRRTFVGRKTDGRTILRFGGVDNAYFVWLNGTYVGFSKGSRIAAEFDVTDWIRDGENLLAVKVYTYSDASYLENQDMLMASGVFRDVMLIRTGKNALWDCTILPGTEGFAVKYTCDTDGSPASLRFTLSDTDGKEISSAERDLTETGEVFLPLENAVTWNAERPYLYTLVIEIAENGVVTEVHTKRAGIAQSEIRGHFLTMNGAPITLKGVNRHENNAKTGRAITAEQIERELYDIKACGLNAIRCSHYTNQPLFYELASELGIYVMDEADCESHGAEASGDQGALNKDPAWFDAFFDRISRMYAMNKNETCINIWSTGNECGAGENHIRCAVWLSEQDVKKPVRTDSELPPEMESFSQTGYMPMQTLFDVPKDAPHPLMMLEYGHAMGNSPGGLEDIWNWVYENEQCCGGYVWEFKSHGFCEKGKDGRPRYLYGGDFPDVYHWSNFSLDGYHTSDGTPKPTWDELREVSAPVHVRWTEDGAEIKNTFDFTPLDGFILRWSVKADGRTVKAGEAVLDGTGPRAWRFFPLPIGEEDLCGLTGLVTADCAFYDPEEHKVAHKQKILADHPADRPAPVPFAHTVRTWDCGAEIKGEDFAVEIRDGLLARIEKEGKILLDKPMRLNCWRAPTDNDGITGFSPRLAGEWKDRLLDTMVFGCYKVDAEDTMDAVNVTAVGKFLPFAHGWGFDAVLTYHITAGGEIGVSVKLDPYGGGQPDVLPRVGVVFALSEDYEHCAWLGRGPGDSYPDRRANAPVGLWEDDVERMNFLYDVPQETGNHEDCRRVTVSGGEL